MADLVRYMGQQIERIMGKLDRVDERLGGLERKVDSLTRDQGDTADSTERNRTDLEGVHRWQTRAQLMAMIGLPLILAIVVGNLAISRSELIMQGFAFLRVAMWRLL